MVVLVRPYRRSARGCNENPIGMGHVQASSIGQHQGERSERCGVDNLSKTLDLICRPLLLPGPRPLQCRDPDSSLPPAQQFRPKPMFTPARVVVHWAGKPGGKATRRMAVPVGTATL